MPAGRPTDYNEEVLEIANAYLENFRTEHGHTIPSVAGLAKVLKKSRDTLYDWAKHEDKKEFSNILRQIVSNQEFELLNSGLNGDFNPQITKLVLGKHGYSDKQDHDLTSGGKPIKNEWHLHPVTNGKD